MKLGAALLAGLLFGLGLILGGMTEPAAVLGFLDIFGQWNPRLVLVMGAALLTTAVGYRLVFHQQHPWFEQKFQLPTGNRLDIRLVTGAALFGMGWGIAGYCPGPALASLSSGQVAVWLLVAAMIAGWWLAAKLLPSGSK